MEEDVGTESVAVTGEAKPFGLIANNHPNPTRRGHSYYSSINRNSMCAEGINPLKILVVSTLD